MSFLKKLFATPKANAESTAAKPAVSVVAVPYTIDLVPNALYCTTRQMFLFPEQDVVADVNDYLLIGAMVTYLESGETFEDNHLIAPWVRVRSTKGKEGWCFAHYLVPATEEDLSKTRKKERHTTRGAVEHWARASDAIAIWNTH